MPDSQESSGPATPVTHAITDPDVFLSYAHSDLGGIVAALHAQLESDLRPLLGRHVEIFLDRSDILDFHDWKVRCHHALRASGFFIVLLSPAYLRSDACRWEWEE
ncbi:MAG: toll/interleukin-1 receptor domain-containing protein [Verrucomicrobia bacterium]|nr:toll/interleukin-1 receptor domain-containing protein [Verrucomicrobiota bacterium]